MKMVAWLAVALSAAGAQDRGNRPPQGKGIEVGRPAADFVLKKLKVDPKEKESRVRLSSFAGQRPVVLIFGSYT